MSIPGRHRRAHARLVAALQRALEADAMALPGTIAQRWTRCGKRTCRCRGEPPQLHGPYLQWTHSVRGKTVTRLLTAEQAAHYKEWIDQARRLRELLHQLEALAVTAAEQAEGWQPPRQRS